MDNNGLSNGMVRVILFAAANSDVQFKAPPKEDGTFIPTNIPQQQMDSNLSAGDTLIQVYDPTSLLLHFAISRNVLKFEILPWPPNEAKVNGTENLKNRAWQISSTPSS